LPSNNPCTPRRFDFICYNHLEMLRKLYWTLTNYCNLGCRYCYYNTGLAKRDFRLNHYRDYQKIIPQFKEHFDEIIFTGGEALLNEDLFKIAADCRRQGLKISLLTNGVLLNKSMISKIIDCGFTTVSVSLDSLDQQINDHQRGQGALVLSNLKQLIRQRHPNLTIEIMQTITRQNLSELLPMFHFCQKNNLIHWVDPVEINPKIKPIQKMALEKLSQSEQKQLAQAMLVWAGSSKDLVDYTQAVMQLIKLQKPTNLFCPMGTSHFVLDVDGSIYPCFMRRDVCLGNLLEQPLTQIIQNKAYQKQTQPKLQKASCVSLGCVNMTMVNKI